MRYFICNLDHTNPNNPQTCLGIPAEHTERIIPAGQKDMAGSEAASEPSGEEVFVSIPALLRLKDPQAPHGLVLKGGSQKRTVLLTPKIDVELEIPEEDIHPLPNTLDDFLFYFRGAFFSGPRVILILDPAKIIESPP